MIVPVLFRREAGDEEVGPIGGCVFVGDCSPANSRGQYCVSIGKQPRDGVLLKLGVSHHSKA